MLFFFRFPRPRCVYSLISYPILKKSADLLRRRSAKRRMVTMARDQMACASVPHCLNICILQANCTEYPTLFLSMCVCVRVCVCVYKHFGRRASPHAPYQHQQWPRASCIHTHTHVSIMKKVMLHTHTREHAEDAPSHCLLSTARGLHKACVFLSFVC